MQMAPYENKFPGTRRLVKNASTLMVALVFLLFSCALAVFLAIQPPAGMTTALTTQSPPATGPEATKEKAAPASAVTDNLPVPAPAIPEMIRRPVAAAPPAAPPAAEAAASAPQQTAPPKASASSAYQHQPVHSGGGGHGRRHRSALRRRRS